MCLFRPLTFLPPSNPQSPFFRWFLRFGYQQFLSMVQHFYQAGFSNVYLDGHSAFGINFYLSNAKIENKPFSKEGNREGCQSIDKWWKQLPIKFLKKKPN